MAQYFLLQAILNNVISVLAYGTMFAYIVYYTYNNYINLSKVDFAFSLIKLTLLSTLSVSFVLYIYFIYCYYLYYTYNGNYVIFSAYNISPKIFQNFFFFLEFSVDIFGVVILFLAYLVGTLSLLALDNRIF